MASTEAPPPQGKKRKKDHPPAPLVPVGITLEPGVRYDAGTLPPPSTPSGHPRQAPLVVFPPPERHTPHTLTALDHPADAGARGYDLVELLAHDNMWHAQTPEDALRSVAAPELLADAEAIAKRKRGLVGANDVSAGQATEAGVPRLVTPTLGSLTYTPAQQAQRFVDRGLVTPQAAERAVEAAAASKARDGLRFTAGDRVRAVYFADRGERSLRSATLKRRSMPASSMRKRSSAIDTAIS